MQIKKNLQCISGTFSGPELISDGLWKKEKLICDLMTQNHVQCILQAKELVISSQSKSLNLGWH